MAKTVNELIGSLLAKIPEERLFGRAVPANPNAQLMSTYGAFSDKFTRAETAWKAFELLSFCVESASSNDPEIKAQANKFLECVSAVASSLAVSELTVSASSVLAAFDANTIDSAIKSCSGVIKDQLTPAYTSSEPLMVELLDVGIAVGATQIPYVGPVVAGYVAGGVQGALSLGVSSAMVYATGTYGPAKPTAWEKAVQGTMKDAPKDMTKGLSRAGEWDKFVDDGLKKGAKDKKVLIAPPKTRGIGLAWYAMCKLKLQYTDNQIASAAGGDMSGLAGEGGVSAMMQLADSVSINPQTRNQLSNSHMSKFVDSTSYNSKASALRDKLKSRFDTIKEIGERLKETQKLLRILLEEILTINVAKSFAMDIKAYVELCGQFRQIMVETPALRQFLLTETDTYSELSSHTRVIALLIVSYFFARAEKNMAPRGPKSPKKADSELKKLAADKNNPVSKAAGVLKKMQRGTNQVNMIDSSFPWKTVEENGKNYVMLLKDVITSDMMAPFRSGNKPSDIEKALKIYMACACIVNDNASRKAAGKAAGKGSVLISTATDIPLGVIRVLEECGVASVYWTFTGTVNDDDKKKYTSQFTKLRWFYRPGASASRSEKMMVYTFACIALSVIDINKIACGFQNWGETWKFLVSIIKDINTAEKVMNTQEEAEFA